jgi:hypothetical protein
MTIDFEIIERYRNFKKSTEGFIWWVVIIQRKNEWASAIPWKFEHSIQKFWDDSSKDGQPFWALTDESVVLKRSWNSNQ